MPRFLALDIDSSGLFLASGSVSRSSLSIERVAALTDQDVTLTPAEAPALAVRLKELLANGKFPNAPLVVGIGRERVVMKDVTFPQVPPQEEPAVVRFQAIKDIAEAPESVMMDYAPSSRLSDGKQRATVVFVRKELLEAIRILAEQAGLKIAAITPRPFALVSAARHAIAARIAAAPHQPDAPIAVLAVTDRGGEFLVYQGKELLFSRTVSPVAMTGTSALIGEMKRNQAMYANQFPGSAIDTLYVAQPPGSRIAESLSASLSCPVVELDPLTGVPDASQIPANLHSRFLGPIGLLASRSPDAPSPINFSAPRQPKAAPNKTRTRVLVGLLLGMVVFAGVFLYCYGETSKAKEQIALLTIDKDNFTKTNTQLKSETKRLDLVEDFDSREVPWVDVFYDLTVQFPDIKKGRLISLEGTLEKPQVAPPRAAPAPPRTGTAPTASAAPAQKGAPLATKKPEPPKNIAKLKLVLAADDIEFADRIMQAFKAPFYEKTTKETGRREGANENTKLYTIETYLLRRDPKTFTEKLIAAPPPPPKVDPEDEFDPLGDPDNLLVPGSNPMSTPTAPGGTRP